MNDILRIVTIFQSINIHHADKVISVREFHYTLISTPLAPSLSTHWHRIVNNFLKKSLAPFLYISPSCIEIISVPWISHFGGVVREVH